MKKHLGKVTLLASGLAIQIGCTSAPRSNATIDPTDSPAYRYALDNAFKDLELRETHQRTPASQADEHTFINNFEKTQYFEMMVTPKLLRLASQPTKAHEQRVVEGPAERFQFRIDRQGHCALAGELVAPEDRDQCVQVEIKPINSKIRGKQYVRVFMTPEYRVMGVSYHEYDSKTDGVKRARKLLQWDPTEPLSSELLALSSEVVPIDLPVYASNRLTKEQGTVTLKQPRKESSCQGWTYRYRNTYGVWVKAGWCEEDPWPSTIETNRYSAILIPGKGN